MRSEYSGWLQSQGYDAGTITAQLHRCGRVESFYGDLDAHFTRDRLAEVMDALRYSTEDERRGLPNPTKLPIRGVIRTNLASYRNAVGLYSRFRSAQTSPSEEQPSSRRSATPLSARATGPTARRTQTSPSAHARTMAEFGFDGRAALGALVGASRYGTLAQAAASLAVFSHPETVEQTGGAALFPIVRGVPGAIVDRDGRRLMTDDNRSPTAAFCWSNRMGGRGRDVQFNHVYARSADPDAYTALANICMTPAFLAKATDTDDEVRTLLAYRSYDLYGWAPQKVEPPSRPTGYATLEWAAPLPPVHGLREVLSEALARKPKDRTGAACRQLGWLFGDAQSPEG